MVQQLKTRFVHMYLKQLVKVTDEIIQSDFFGYLNVGGNLKVWNKPIDDYTQENWYQSVTALPFYPADALNAYPDGLIPYNQSGIRPYINPDMGEVRLNWQGGQGFQRLKSNELNVDVKFNQKLDFIVKKIIKYQ